MAISVKHAFQSAKADGPDSTLVQPSSWNAEHTITAAAGVVLGRNTSGAGAIQELPIAVDVSGNVALAGALTVDGNTTFGNASTDTVTVNSASVSFANATTIAGALSFSGAIAFNGNTTLGDASTDTVTLNAATVSIPNNVNFSGGNVGIGTSSPGAKLTAVDNSANDAVRITQTGAGNAMVVRNSTDLSQNLFVITSAGSVGIGQFHGLTNSKLVVEGQSPGADGAYATGVGSIVLNEMGRTALSNNGGLEFKTSVFGSGFGAKIIALDAGELVIGQRANSATWTERMRIDSAGNVGIGTSSLSSKLDVGGTIRSSGAGTDPGSGSAFYFVGSGAFQTVIAGAEFAVHTGANNARAERLRVTSAGTLNSQPTYDNTATGSTVIVTSTGQIRRTSSSIKYKKDVETLDPTLATHAIERLRPVWYRTKNAEGDDKATWSHIGLIAEEVDLVEPRLVRYRTAEVIEEQKPVLDEAGEPVLDEEGNPTFTTEQVVQELAVPEPEDVDYARLSVLLLAEVQSLRDRIAALEARP